MGYTSRPAAFAAYVASVGLGDAALSVEIARRGLVANPKSFALQNSLVYGLACGGRTEEAWQSFQAIEPPTEGTSDYVVWLATQGLVKFRQGKHAEGRSLYVSAINTAIQKEFWPTAAAGFLYFVIEEMRAQTPEAPKLREQGIGVAAKLDGIIFLPLKQQFERMSQTSLELPKPLSLLGIDIGRINSRLPSSAQTLPPAPAL